MECRQGLGCDPKMSRRMYSACVTGVPGTWVPGVHADCSHNENAALLLRSLGATPNPAEGARGPVVRVFRDMARLASRYGGGTWTHLQTAESYSGKLRRRYMEAEVSLREDGPVRSGDAFLRAFVKADKCCFMSKVAKPRLIYPRSPRYNLDLASRLKPFEHWLWGRLRSYRFFGVPQTRLCAKGLSQFARASLIRRKMSAIPGCSVIEVDGKSFEAHEDVWQLVEEQRVYRAAFPGDKGLDGLLSYQLNMRGVTKGGIRFSRPGGRASGDFNTGMGNTLVMLAVTIAACRELAQGPFDCLADGDNCLLFLSPGDLPRFQERFAPLVLRMSGHEMTVERPAAVLEEVRFGQSAPLVVGSEVVMVRDWRKVISHMMSSHAGLTDLRTALPWLRGVFHCESFLARGVPILGEFTRLGCLALQGERLLDFDWYRDYAYLGVSQGGYAAPVSVEVSVAARESFFLAFGVDPAAQLEIERSLRVCFDLRPWEPLEAPTVFNWWSGVDDAIGGFFGG